MAATNSARSMNLIAAPSRGYSTHIFCERTKMAQRCSFLLSLFSRIVLVRIVFSPLSVKAAQFHGRLRGVFGIGGQLLAAPLYRNLQFSMRLLPSCTAKLIGRFSAPDHMLTPA